MPNILVLCIVLGLAVLAYGLWTRRVANRSPATTGDTGRAAERHLSEVDLRMLHLLAADSSATSTAELMNSHELFDRAAAAYVDSLRARAQGDSAYFAAIRQLTRLRRRLRWSPGSRRAFSSTRDLEHGAVVTVLVAGRDVPAVVRLVDEDHFSLRLLSPDLAPTVVAGQALACRLVRPKEGIVSFSPVVRDRSASSPVTLDLEHTARMTLQNRREYPREKTNAPVVLMVPGVETPVRAKLCDLSAGGLSFVTCDPLQAGTVIGVELELGHRTTATRVLSATINRCQPGSTPQDHRVTACWNIVKNADRDRLTEHVFRLQLLQRRTSRDSEHVPHAGD